MTTEAIQAAIERGDATARVLIKHRDQLFEPCEALLLIAGPDGLRTCAAGVVEAVIAASKRPPHQPEAQP